MVNYFCFKVIYLDMLFILIYKLNFYLYVFICIFLISYKVDSNFIIYEIYNLFMNMLYIYVYKLKEVIILVFIDNLLKLVIFWDRFFVFRSVVFKYVFINFKIIVFSFVLFLIFVCNWSIWFCLCKIFFFLGYDCIF